MIDSDTWAMAALAAWRAAVRDDADVAAGFQRRVAVLFAACQRDALVATAPASHGPTPLQAGNPQRRVNRGPCPN